MMAVVLGAAPAPPTPRGSSPLRFQFGEGAARPGFTKVSPATLYSKETGYGFEPGTAPLLFSVAVPEGNYRVTVTLGDRAAATVTTVKAETRRLMLERVATRAGQFVRRTFTVNVRGPLISSGGSVQLDGRERDLATGEPRARHWDDKLTLAFSDAHPAPAAVEIRRVEGVVTLFLVGDSTVTDQATSPGSSWGQMVTRWFGPEVAVANHAESGETLRGFLKERRWDKVLDSVRPGDYVLIEFGTNDSKDHGPQNIYPGQDFSETYAPAETTYKELLRRYVADVRGKGAFPIIASPSARRQEVAKPTSLGAYAVAAMDVAREMGVPGIDLNSMGVALNVALGADAGRQFGDRTHHVEYGSYLQAKCIVLGIRQGKLPLARFIRDDFGRFDPTHPEPTPAAFALPLDPSPIGEPHP
jgi:lysophospholipase L1-like esterase